MVYVDMAITVNESQGQFTIKKTIELTQQDLFDLAFSKLDNTTIPEARLLAVYTRNKIMENN